IAVAGFSTRLYAIAFAGVIGFNFVLLTWYARASGPRRPVWMLIGSGLLIAVLARMFSPFLSAPGFAAVTAMVVQLGVMPATARSAAPTIALLCAALLVPWIAEVVGWLTPSFYSTPTELVILPPGIQSRETVGDYVFVGYTLALISVTVLLVQ